MFFIASLLFTSVPHRYASEEITPSGDEEECIGDHCPRPTTPAPDVATECIEGVCSPVTNEPHGEECVGDHCQSANSETGCDSEVCPPTTAAPPEPSTTPYWDVPEGFEGDITGYNEETFKAVVQNVLDQSDKATVPKINFSEPLELRILFDLLSLASFDELSGEISLVASLTLHWSAETTPKWNPNFMLGGKESVTISAADVWRPQLFILNPSKKVQDLTSDLNRLRLGYDGLVEWNIVTILEVSRTSRV